MSQWGYLSRQPNLHIWGETTLCIKVSISGRTSILFHKARVTMMIWKQRAKLVMATARWALKHPVYGIVILRLGIYTNRPNVSKLCSFIGSMNPSILISVILENNLSVSLLFPKDMFALYEWFMLPMTITCRPSRSFFLFLFVSFFTFAKTIHPSPSMRKAFLCTPTFLYTTNFFCIHTH